MPPPPWEPLHVDLCALAMGANSRWGTPSIFMPQSKPVDTQTRYSSLPTCFNVAARSWLQAAPIYVCPGSHRPRSWATSCGYDSDYFCGAWTCETTGDVYWKPTSNFDYITVKRTNPSPYQLNSGPIPYNNKCKQWCNSLTISFTDNGKKKSWEGRGYQWGLRLYISGYNLGLTFKIKLQKTIPNAHKASVGPNSMVHKKQHPKNPT